MNEPEIVLTIIGSAVMGGLLIGAMSVFLSFRERMYKIKSGSQPTDAVAAELDDLRNEVALLREDVGDTMERIDVTERMLSSERHVRLPPS